MNADKIANIIFAILFALGALLGVAAINQALVESVNNASGIVAIFGMLTAIMAFSSGYQVFRFFVPDMYA